MDLWAAVRVARILHKRPSEVLAWGAWEIALIIGDAVQEHEAIEKRTPQGTASSAQPSVPGSPGARTTTQSFRFVVKKKE